VKTTIKTCTVCQSPYEADSTHICSGSKAPDPVAQLLQPQVGMVIDKKYRLQNKLGEGGMGSVFRARRLFMDDFVAIKFMRPEVMANPEIRQRFYQEAQVAARVKHPNVVMVYDFGETVDGLVYLVMEFLEGMSLGQLLKKKGALGLKRVFDIGIQICEALTCMLENNVIHRDLKPDNIMLVKDGQENEMVKVVDFGVAKMMASDSRLTRIQARIGSPVYCSPEQYLGRPVDHRTDLYGLGVIFYECFTGRVPFEGLSEAELVSAIANQTPPRLDEEIKGFNSYVADLVQWLLAKNSDDRPYNAAQVKKCLQALRRGQRIPREPRQSRREQSEALFSEMAGMNLEPSPSAASGLAMEQEEFLPASAPPELLLHQEPGAASAGDDSVRVASAKTQPRHRFNAQKKRRVDKRRRLENISIFLGIALMIAVLIWKVYPVAAVRAYVSQAYRELISSLILLAADGPANGNDRQPPFSKQSNGLASQSSRAGLSFSPSSKNSLKIEPARAGVVPGEIAVRSPEKAAAMETNPKNELGSTMRNPARTEPLRVNSAGNKSNGARSSDRVVAPPNSTRPISKNAASLAALAPPRDMVLVKGLVYKRGDLWGNGEPNERPAHYVRVQDFLIGKHEVTNREYMAFVEATGKHLPEWMNPDSKYHYQTGTDNFYKKLGPALYNLDHPVVGVSWEDAVAYCQWLSQRGAIKYRLPTEAEWELAARGGNTQVKYSWGNGSPTIALGGNVADESLKKIILDLPFIWRDYNDNYTYTAPVGKFGANPLGLSDMTGNVWEWCGDWYDANAYKKQEMNNPKGPLQGTERVIRGGSWSDTPAKLCLSYRRGVPPQFRSNNLGFRVAASLP
jgi:formylglycine-generating enzyme required for sulfatase activity/serine/threonine protein kinase